MNDDDSPRNRNRRPEEEAESVAGRPPNPGGPDRPENPYHETDFHGSHRDGEHRHTPPLSSTVEIAGEERSVATLVELERLRRQYSGEVRCLMEATGQSTQRGVITALVAASPRTYADLSTWTRTTTRTVKTHVSTLSERGVLSVEDGRPATIAFRNDDLRLLASDILSYGLP